MMTDDQKLSDDMREILEGDRIMLSAFSPKPPISTVKDYHRHHEEMCARMPLGIELGPFMVLGRRRRWFAWLSRLAFWLLRWVGWELVSSRESEFYKEKKWT